MGFSWSKPQEHNESEVEAFLARIGLQVYTQALMRDGWDDMETLLAMEVSDMREAGLTPVHTAVLRAALGEETRRRQAADGSKVVVAFLHSVGLERYAAALVGHGFDEMETLVLMGEADMKELGIPRGHVLKLKKKLQEYQEGTHQVPQDQPETAAAANEVVAAPARLDQPPKRATSLALHSWQQVKLVGLDSVGEMLRANTFAIDTEVVKLFRIPGVISTGDGMLQRMALRHLFSKVVRFVGSVVAGRYDYLRLVETLTRLGATRAAAGATEAHFGILKEGLSATLQQVLGDAYTEEVKHAWMTAYSFNAAIMIDGMRMVKGGDAAAGAGKTKSVEEGDHAAEALRKLSSYGA